MPYVNVKVTRSGLTREKKAEFVARITATLAGVFGVVLLGVSFAGTAKGEPVLFEDAVAKRDWHVWSSAHRRLGVAWKSPLRLSGDARSSDAAGSTTINLIDDAQGLSIAALVQPAAAATTEEATRSCAERLGLLTESVVRTESFAGEPYGFLVLGGGNDGVDPVEWLLVRVDGREATHLSFSFPTTPNRTVEAVLDSLAKRVRVTRGAGVATRSPIGADANRPRERDWRAAEAAVRRFLLAITFDDDARLRENAIIRPGFEVLRSGGIPPQEALSAIRRDIDARPIRRLQVGETLTLPDGRSLEITDAMSSRQVLYLLPSLSGGPMPSPMTVVNVNGAWKVDPAPLIAGRRAAMGSR